MTDERFETLLAAAFEDPDIEWAFRQWPVSRLEVAAEIRKEREEIFAEAAEPLTEEGFAARAVANIEEHLAQKTWDFVTWTEAVGGRNPWFPAWAFNRLLLKENLPPAVRNTLVALLERAPAPSRVPAKTPTDSLWMVLRWVRVFVFYYFTDVRVRKNVEQFASERDEYLERIAKARQQLDAIIENTDRVLTRLLRSQLRSTINSLFETRSRSATLPNIRPTGLAEVFDARYEIPTSAKREILRVLTTMPGGAIGVSGPRGAGKSTLLRAIATSVSEIKIGDDVKPVIGVLTSAPVQYDPRDFLLHLFASTCNRIVGKEPISTSESLAPEPAWTQFVPLVQRIVPPIVTIAAFIGIFQLASGLMALFTNAGVGFVDALGAKTVDLITRGFFWLAGGFIMLRFAASLAKEAARKPAVATPAPVPKPARFTGSDESWEAIVATARDRLADIRFQRSYSHGWSGALKLPVGMEASVNQAYSWSQRQLTLPELTKLYTDFLALLSAHVVVVIAIDELDKIGSDQKAHEFLNEIKAVFGVERCFYLLSVSDSAMSSFARRGLPVRDAFDSALDDVVRVEYLSHDAVNELISRRIIQFPLPFVSFCHCLSGGLPRDVIRACRDVFDAAEGMDSRNLPDLARAVLRQDLKQKIAATVTAVRQSVGVADASGIIESLGNVAIDDAGPADLLGHYSGVLDAARASAHRTSQSLAIDFATYCLYAATLIEIFDRSSSGDAWEAAAKAGTFDDLAALRRRLEIDSDACRGELLRLRTRWTLPAPRLEKVRPAAASSPRRYLPRLPVKVPRSPVL